MSGTLEDALGPVTPYVPEALVSADRLADIAAVARELPGGLSSFLGFECRLGHAERRADFLVRTRVDGGEREHLAGTGPDAGLPERLLQHPVWTRVRDYARLWGAPGSPLHRGSDRLWLEFDLDGSSSGIPIPSVFLGQSAGGPAAGDHADWWVTETALPLLGGQRLPGAVARRLTRCVDALPPGATLFSIGVMLSRPSDAVRLCIADLGVQGIPEYLRQIGWNGALPDVTDLLARWPALVDRIGLQIDVSEDIGPKIGLEYHLPATPGGTPSWRPFLDALVEDGLCRPDKRDGLLAYQGVSDEMQDGARWPERLLRASRLLGHDWVSVNRRSLQYIKLGHETGRPLEAKAYLGALYAWVNRAATYSQSSTDGSRSGSDSRSSS